MRRFGLFFALFAIIAMFSFTSCEKEVLFPTSDELTAQSPTTSKADIITQILSSEAAKGAGTEARGQKEVRLNMEELPNDLAEQLKNNREIVLDKDVVLSKSLLENVFGQGNVLSDATVKAGNYKTQVSDDSSRWKMWIIHVVYEDGSSLTIIIYCGSC